MSSAWAEVRTSAGIPPKVTALPSGSGSKPRPLMTTRSPTGPLSGATSRISGRRPMMSSTGFAAAGAGLDDDLGLLTLGQRELGHHDAHRRPPWPPSIWRGDAADGAPRPGPRGARPGSGCSRRSSATSGSRTVTRGLRSTLTDTGCELPPLRRHDDRHAGRVAEPVRHHDHELGLGGGGHRGLLRSEEYGVAAGSARSCSPVRVAAWPDSTLGGFTAVSSGGTARRKNHHTAAPSTPRIATSAGNGENRNGRTS